MTELLKNKNVIVFWDTVYSGLNTSVDYIRTYFMTVTNLVTAKRIGVWQVVFGWSEFMGEQNQGRCYQHNRVRTTVNVLGMLAATAAVVC